MIAIIDYGMGNLRSVEKGFLKVGVDAVVTNRPEVVKKADGVALPGVGAFKGCMMELTNLNLIDAVVDTRKEGDTSELKYFFTAKSFKCDEVEAGRED